MQLFSRALIISNKATFEGGKKHAATIHYPTFSDQEMARRHRAIQTLMDQEGVDALLVYGTGRYSSDVYWLT